MNRRPERQHFVTGLLTSISKLMPSMRAALLEKYISAFNELRCRLYDFALSCQFSMRPLLCVRWKHGTIVKSCGLSFGGVVVWTYIVGTVPPPVPGLWTGTCDAYRGSCICRFSSYD
ncbi:hypothetical protein BDW71DRAFT_46198 [Aspergillus fruticulosus]